MSNEQQASAREVFSAFLRLGLTSFGGPVAHLSYFRTEFVARRRWLTEHRYGELLALCQFLPGPASSQLAFVLGLLRAGWRGAIAAFIAFTLPSVALLVAFAYWDTSLSGSSALAAVHGLKLTAVCVVAQAVIGMASTLTTTALTRCIAIVGAITILLADTAWMQLVVIVLSATTAAFFARSQSAIPSTAMSLTYGRFMGSVLLTLFGVLLALAFIAPSTMPRAIYAAANFYRAGSLVFGGGHVVLPLLQETVVKNGLVDANNFMTGYGAAQAVPGPMFSLAAYLGIKIAGLTGVLVCVAAIFLPGFLLVSGVLPFWNALQSQHRVRGFISGANAAVVGILAAALYDPIYKSAIGNLTDIAIAIVGIAFLIATRRSALWVVAWCVFSSMALSLLH